VLRFDERRVVSKRGFTHVINYVLLRPLVTPLLNTLNFQAPSFQTHPLSISSRFFSVLRYQKATRVPTQRKILTRKLRASVSLNTNSVALVPERTIPTDRRLSVKLVPTFADRGCRVVRATDPQSRILGFLDRSRYCFFQVAPQLYS
jgi:hypothetical protein